jgi:hypothetical protein
MLRDASRYACFSYLDEKSIPDDDRAVQDDEAVEAPCSTLQGASILNAVIMNSNRSLTRSKLRGMRSLLDSTARSCGFRRTGRPLPDSCSREYSG